MAVLTSAGITFGDATTQTTAATAAALVTTTNVMNAFAGQTFLDVGTIMVLYNFSNSGYYSNQTIPAANAGYVSGNAVSNNYLTISYALRTGNVTTPGAGGSGSYPNTTAVTGTWRVLSGVGPRGYDSCSGTTAQGVLCVRIA